MSYPGRRVNISPPTIVIMPIVLFSFLYCLKTSIHNINIQLPVWWNSYACRYTNYANEKVEEKKKSPAAVYFRNSIVQRVPALGQAVSLTNRCKYVAVSECMLSYSVTLRLQARCLGDDMCYFACKFFSDSPPSEPTESASVAGLKTEVCFYD